MNKIMTVVTTGLIGMMLAGVAGAATTEDPLIQKREQRQEKRIQQGVKSGKLTKEEAAKLEAQQTKIKQDEAAMKADGKLTPAERRKLRKEQNKASKEIYKQKHNAINSEVK